MSLAAVGTEIVTTLPPPQGPPAAPMGARGERPVGFFVPWSREELEPILNIPGTDFIWGAPGQPNTVTCTWDVAWRLAELFHCPCPGPDPSEGPVDAPGLARYDALGFREKARQYQKDGALYLIRRAWAILSYPMRTGKSLCAIMAAVLVDSRATLIVAPSLAKWVWASELRIWAGEAALILEGRGGREARRICVPCEGRGYRPGPLIERYTGEFLEAPKRGYPELPPFDSADYVTDAPPELDGEPDEPKEPEELPVTEVAFLDRQAPIEVGDWAASKDDHKQWHWARVEEADLELNDLGQQMKGCVYARATRKVQVEQRDPCPDCIQRNGQSYGYQIYRVEKVNRRVKEPNADGKMVPVEPPVFQCPIHEDVRTMETNALCVQCRHELLREIAKSPYVIVNYDILSSQEDSADLGEDRVRLDLPGWSAVLAHILFDVAILDECHLLRGRPEKERRGISRRDRLMHALQKVPRVWGLTGTPIFGYTRDLWGQFDVISNGLWGQMWWDFDTRYCEGHKGEYGWVADGRSILAETELKRRLSYVLLKKERSELPGLDLPEKIRQVHHIEPDKKLPVFAMVPNESRRMHISRGLSATLDYKIEAIVKNVVTEMAEGNRVVLYHFLKASAERVYVELDKAMKARSVRTRMRTVDAQLWLAHGEVSDKGRFDMARDFREHQGAGAFITTTDAMQVAVSLKGAASAHFSELHWNPAAMLQAEDRPYENGIPGYSVVYYVLKGSLDEHIENVVLPKYKTLEAMVNEEGATQVRDAFYGEAETVDAIWERLTSHLN